MTTTYTYERIGTRTAGECIVCGRRTGSKRWEMDGTLVYTYTVASVGRDGEVDERQAEAVCHVDCAGAVTKSAVGGGIKFRRPPRETITVGEEA